MSRYCGELLLVTIHACCFGFLDCQRRFAKEVINEFKLLNFYHC